MNGLVNIEQLKKLGERIVEKISAIPAASNTWTGKNTFRQGIEVEPSTGKPILVGKLNNARTLVYSSSTEGEHLFGGNNDGSESMADYIRVGSDKLQYRTGGNTYNLYHEGHKPTAAEIGAKLKSEDHLWKVKDIRGGVRQPNYFTEGQATGFFSSDNMPAGDWYAGMNIKGWTHDYSSWQLASRSSDEASDEKLWFRGSNNETSWKPWREIYHTGHKPTASEIGAIAAGNWSTNGGQDLLVHGKRALVGTTAGALHLSYGGDFPNVFINGNEVYHTGHKPTPSEISAPYADASLSVKGYPSGGSLDNIVGNGIYAYSPSTGGIPSDNRYGSVMNFGNVASLTPGTQEHWCNQLAFGTDGQINRRYRTNLNSWSSWSKVYTSLYKPTAGEIGAAASSHNHTALSGTDKLRMTTNYGYLEIGPRNSGHCHYVTDRDNHWFDKQVKVQGEIYVGSSYNSRVFHKGYEPSALAQGGIWVVVNNDAKDGGYFCPGTNQITHLGLWNNSWEGIYAKNAPSQTSDRKAKTNIVELEKREKTTREFFMKLKPSMYNMLGREGEPEDRVDFGFIAQDVEQAITETFGSHKFSLVEKHYKPSEEEIPQVMPEENGEVDERREISLKNYLTTENMTAEEEREFLDAQPDEKLSYHLKYTELIPINTLMIQENIEDIEILQKELLAKDKKIEELEDRLANIEKLLAKLS